MLFYFFICSSFFSAARGQTVGPILTSDTSKCVFLGELHSFWSLNNDVAILGGQNFRKPPKIGTNMCFPAKMPQSYNSNISKSINRIKLKFEPEAETKRC